MLCDKDCPIVESGTRNWSWFLFQQAAFVLLPDICQPNGLPGQAVPIPQHPRPAPANNNGGVVAKYNRQMDLYREFETMKTLYWQALKYAYDKSGALRAMQTKHGTLTDNPLALINYLWNKIPEDQWNSKISTLEDKLKADFDPNQKIEIHLDRMNSCRTALIRLGQYILDDKMIRDYTCALRKHKDMEKPLGKYKKIKQTLLPMQITWPHFCRTMEIQVAKFAHKPYQMNAQANSVVISENKENIIIIGNATSALGDKLTQFEAENKKLRSEMAEMKEVIASLKQNKRPRTGKKSGRGNTYNYPWIERLHPDSLDYCSSHGFDCDHNSENCPNPSKYHKKNATAYNHKQGCTCNTHLIPPEEIWRCGTTSKTISSVTKNNKPPIKNYVLLLRTNPNKLYVSVVQAKLDTAATGKHMMPVSCPGEPIPHEPLRIVSATNNTMDPVGTNLLPLHPKLSDKAQKAATFPNINVPLISVPRLCDDGCECVIDQKKATCTKEGTTVLEAERNQCDGMWDVTVKTPKAPDEATNKIKPLWGYPANSAYTQQNAVELQQWHHMSLSAPTPSPLIKAVKNNHLVAFPGLSVEGIWKHLLKSIQTTMGHMKQKRQGIWSTKKKPATVTEINELMTMPDPNYEEIPASQATFKQTHKQTLGISGAINFDELTGVISSDQTGGFPLTSRRGNKYTLIIYNYDSNSIYAVPIPSRHQEHLVCAYEIVYGELHAVGIVPVLHKLDNEVSKLAIQFMEKNKMRYKLAPLRDHHALPSERALQTYKDIFIATLWGVDKNFPRNQWDYLVPEAQLNCNLLRQSRINPKLSAYAQVWGQYDYNTHPLTPPGCKCVIYNSPDDRLAFSKKRTEGFYIGPSMKHCRNYEVYIPTTGGVRDGLTVEFFPKHGQMPTTTKTDWLAAALEDIWNIAKGRHNETNNVIEELRAIFTHQTDSVKPPRVEWSRGKRNKKRTKHTAPRVQNPPSLAPILEQEHPIGTKIKKLFAGKIHRGEITPYSPIRDLYWVDFKNGKYKELNYNDIKKYKCEDQNHNNLLCFTSTALKWHHNANQAKEIPQFSTSQIPTGFTNAVFDKKTGKMLNYRKLMQHPDPLTRATWQQSSANEWGRLLQGVGMKKEGKSRVISHDTLWFTKKQNISKNKKISYARFACEERPQ